MASGYKFSLYLAFSLYKSSWVKSFNFDCDFTIFDFAIPFVLKQSPDLNNLDLYIYKANLHEKYLITFI